MAHLRRGHAPPPQGRLGEGALTDRARGSRRARTREHRPQASARGRLLRLGPRAARRGERGAEPAPGGRAAPRASGGEGHRRDPRGKPTTRWVAPLCCSAGSTRRGAWATARSTILRRHPGFAAHALHLLGDIATHPDRFDAERGEAHYRKALALAEPRGMRPLVAHCHLGLGRLYRRTGKGEQAQEHLDHRDDDVPRDGHDVLAGEGGGGDEATGVRSVEPRRPR